MAEGWLRHLAGDRFEVASAGTHPVGLNPLAVDAMKEIGIDISRQESKKLDRYLHDRFDHVITVCDRAKESCPIFPGASQLSHWSFEDPAAVQGIHERRLVAFRSARDQIGSRIREFLRMDA
jgi:arsenate reductase